MGISIDVLNLVSLVLGLAAWVLPFFGASRRRVKPMSRYVNISLVCCLFALYFQLLATAYLVGHDYMVAVTDLAEFRAEMAWILLAVTLGLNYMCSGVRRRRDEQVDELG